jgi:hypothetical protein
LDTSLHHWSAPGRPHRNWIEVPLLSLVPNETYRALCIFELRRILERCYAVIEYEGRDPDGVELPSNRLAFVISPRCMGTTEHDNDRWVWSSII